MNVCNALKFHEQKKTLSFSSSKRLRISLADIYLNSKFPESFQMTWEPLFQNLFFFIKSNEKIARVSNVWGTNSFYFRTQKIQLFTTRPARWEQMRYHLKEKCASTYINVKTKVWISEKKVAQNLYYDKKNCLRKMYESRQIEGTKNSLKY